MQVRRIGPDGAFVREFTDVRKRVESLESRPAGSVFFQSVTTRDPETGNEIVIGVQPDGSYGIEPYVGDTTPPPVATAPTVTANPGTATIWWDGNFSGGSSKPKDFEHLNVIGHKIVSNATVSSKQVGIIRLSTEPAFVTVDQIPVGDTYEFSFESVDYNGNTSTRSARSNRIIMDSVMSDVDITNALQGIADDNAALQVRVDTTQADLSDAQALADALLAKGSNLVVNGDFESPIVAGKPIKGWPTRVLSYVEPASATGTTARSGNFILRAAPTTTTAYAYTDYVASAKDRVFSAEMWVKLAATAPVASGAVGFYFTELKTDGTTFVSSQANSSGVSGVALTAGNLSTSSYTKIVYKYTTTQASTKIRFAPRLTGNGNVYIIDDFKVMDVTEADAAQTLATQAYANAQQAANDAGTAQTSANSKNTNWYSDNPPAGINHKDGDTWFDTNDDNRIYIWNATAGALGTGAWVDMRDKAIAAATAAASGALASANGKNTNYYGNTAPTGGQYKDGDAFFNVAEGNKLYIYSTSGGTTGFKPFQDQAISIANQAATGAQATADGKNKSYYTGTAPTNVPAGTLKNGDLWFDTNNNYRLNTWNGTAWQTTQDAAAASALAATKGRTLTQSFVPAVEFRNATTIWNDTSLGLDQVVVKYWNPALLGGAGDWEPIADKGIKKAQNTADAVPLVIMSSTTPAASAQKTTTLWIDTSGGINLHKKYDAVNGWTVVADSRISSTAVAVTAADNKAQNALDEAAKKGRTFTGAVQPAVEFRNANNLWIDTSLGDNMAVTKRWDSTLNSGAGGWTPVKDAAISQAQTDAQTAAAADAKAKADAAYAAAITAQGFSSNPSFDDWTSTLPTGYSSYGTAGTQVKETTLVRRGTISARFSVAASGTSSGLNLGAGAFAALPNVEYYTLESDIYLVSGALDGAGVLVDWAGLTPYRTTVNFASSITNPVTGKWYRVSQVVRRPTTSTGTWTGMSGYLMANYGSAGLGPMAVKELVVDWLNLRPSTAEEILAYLSPADAQAKATQAKLDAIADTAPKLAAKSATFFQAAKPTGGTYLKGDIWIDTDDGNKIYVYDGVSDFIVAQDSAIDKALYSTFPSTVDSNAANKWLYTRYEKNLVSGSTPQYSDIVGFAGTSALVDAGTDLVKNQGSNYMGMLRTVVQVVSSKTISITATHDDGGRIYVDGTSVYSNGLYKTNQPISFTLSAGWHVLDLLWNEISGNDGWYGITPTILSQVDAMFAPVSLTSVSSMASAAQTAANGKNQVVYSNSDASGTTGTNGQPYIAGDTWFKRSLTSPFNIIGQWEYSGSAWISRKIDGLTIANIDAGTITVGTLSGQQISATAIDGKTITGATVQTSSGATTGIKLTPTELMGYDGGGNKNFSLTTGGTLAIKGTIQSGSTISGANLSASGIYTNPAVNRGVKILDTGINAWDASGVPTFILNASTGEVQVPGLKANSINGTMIAADTISVSNLMVSDLANFAPSFAESPGDWTLTGGMNIVGTAIDPSGYRLDTAATSGTSWAYGPYMAVKPGETLYGTATSYRSGTGTGAMYLRYYWFDKDKVLLSPAYTGSTQISTSPSGTKFEVTATVPALAAYTRITLAISSTAANNGFWNISGRRMNGGELIVDGAIDGKTITGALIQTTSSPVSGSSARGIKLTPNELAGFDGAGNKNFSLGVDGSLTMTGDIQTGSTITGATITGAGIQTTSLATKGIKITSSGVSAFNASNGLTFAVDAATGVVDAPGIRTNSLKGTMIASNTITVDNLNVASLDNLITEPTFLTGGSQWIVGGAYSIDSTGARNGGPAWKIANAASQQGAYNKPNWLPVEEGQSYRMSAYVKADVSIPVSAVALYITTKNAAGTQSVFLAGVIGSAAQAVTGVIPANTWTLVEGSRTLPVGAVAANFGVYSQTALSTGNLWVDYVSATRMSGGKLIVDGSIQTNHMTSGTIDAGVLVAGSITGDKIQAGSITTEKLVVGLGTNLIPDPGFVAPSMEALRNTNSTMTVSYNYGTDSCDLITATTGTYYFRALGITQSAAAYTNWIPVTPGEKYVFTATVTLPAGGSGDIRLTGRTKDGQSVSTAFSAVLTDPLVPGVYNTFPALVSGASVSYYAEVPANCYWMLPEIRVAGATGTFNIPANSMSLRRRSTGELIVDGSILTQHMKSGTIDAGVLSAASITSDLIAADAITAKVISIGDFTNIATGGGFDTASDKANWSLDAGVSYGTSSPAPGSIGYINSGTSATTRFATLTYLPSVIPGDKYAISFMYKTTSDFNGTTGNSKVRIGDQVDGFQYNVLYNVVSTSWTAASGVYTVPASGVSSIKIKLCFDNTAGTVFVDNLRIIKQSDATLIEDNAIYSQHITAGAIDASKISANAITASAVASKSITADKLIISSSQNLIIEPDFSLGAVSWETTATNKDYRAGGGRAGADAFRFTGTTSTQSSYNMSNKVGNVKNKVTVEDDNRFRGSIWVKSSAALSSDKVRLGLRYTTSVNPLTTGTVTIINNSSVSTASNYLPANTWTQLSGISSPLPSNTVYVEFYIQVTLPTTTDTVDFDTVSITRASDGTLVVDGAIDGKLITGATFQTSGSAKTGIKIDTTSLKAYNPAQSATFDLNAVTGDVTLTGTIQTSFTGSRAKVWDRGDGTAAVDLYTDTTGQHGSIYTQPQTGNGGYVTNVMHYTANTISATNWTARLTLFADETWSVASRTKNTEVTGDASGQIYFRGKMVKNNSAPTETFVVGSIVSSQNATGSYALTYATPVASGTRTVLASPDAAAYVSCATQSATASGFTWIWSTSANASVSMRYLAVWTT